MKWNELIFIMNNLLLKVSIHEYSVIYTKNKNIFKDQKYLK